MDIEYDVTKNQRNIELRGLSFGEVVNFDFVSAHITQDTRVNYQELRYVATGYLVDRLHILCYTKRKGNIRVISFRKANKRERENYAKTYK